MKVGETSTTVMPGRYAIAVGLPEREAPPGWVWTPLSDVSELGTGHTPSRKHAEYWSGDIPWMGIKDAAAHHGGTIYDTIRHTNELGIASSAARLLPKDTVCLSRTASIGYVVILGTNMATSQDFATWTTFEEVLVPQFLQLALIAEGSELRRFGKGTTHTTIYFSEIKALHICLPPINEQHRIVEKTMSGLRQSENAKRLLDSVPSLFDVYRQSILASAYRGELTLTWRNRQAEVKALDSVILGTPEPVQTKGGRRPTSRVLPGQFALSVNLPPLDPPSGWDWVPLSRVARQETGHTPSRRHPEYWNGEIGWLGIKDAREHHGTTIFDTLQHITPSGLANSASRMLPAGTVCLSRTASIGYSVILGKEMATSQDFVSWICTDAILPKFLMYLFMAEGRSLRLFGRGTTHSTIYFPELRAFHVCLPSPEEQAEVVKRCELYVSTVERLSVGIASQRSLLVQLEQCLLSMAFRGQLISPDPNDESVSRLLENASHLRAKYRARRSPPRRKGTLAMVKKESRRDVYPVVDVLKREGIPLSARALLIRAGYATDVSPEDLEKFFLDLRENLNAGAITRRRQGDEDIFELRAGGK